MQLSLFSSTATQPTARTGWGPLDPLSEEALARFQVARTAEGAHGRTIAWEMSNLRALIRASAAIGGPSALPVLFVDLPRVAQVLMAPPALISRSTGRARLLVAQQYIRVACMAAGHDPTDALLALDRLLPARSVARWHSTGIIVAGTAERQRRRGPTLSEADLVRLVVAAGKGKDAMRTKRDKAMVALQCFSGIRAEEIVHMRWEHVCHIIVPPGRVALIVNVLRGHWKVQLPILSVAVEALEALAAAQGGSIGVLTGPVWRAANRSERPLGYRAARDVLRAACREIGLPTIETRDLRAACAYWLRTGGLSDHEVMTILGLRRVKSADRLLDRHLALEAQRLAQETLSRQ